MPTAHLRNLRISPAWSSASICGRGCSTAASPSTDASCRCVRGRIPSATRSRCAWRVRGWIRRGSPCVSPSRSRERDREPLPDAAATKSASEAYWPRFWTDGGTLDLSASADPRAKELERRIVLSEYLTAVNCAGTMPPQETGETFNSWFGKAHL